MGSAFAQEWERIYESPTGRSYASDIVFVDTSLGFKSGWWSNGEAETVYLSRTNDGGQHWQRNESIGFIWDFEFLNSDTGFSGGSVLASTCDGGEHWNIARDLREDYLEIIDIFFINDTTGWAVGGDMGGVAPDSHWVPPSQLVLHTIDAGRTWETQLYIEECQRGGMFMAVAFSDVDRGLMVDEVGIVYRTEDGGDNWEIVNSLGYTEVIIALDEETFITTFNHTIQRTEDFGDNWETVSEFATSDLFFIDSQHGWGCSRNLIVYTEDSGEHWEPQLEIEDDEFEYDQNFLELFFLDENNGWAMTWNWDVWRYSGNQQWVKDDSPTQVSSYSFNAYPNPFNNITLLSFESPFQGLTEIRLFDTNGRTVQTLMNKQLPQGNHSVIIDGSSLASGVYLVNLSLTAGNRQIDKTVKVVHLP